MFEHKTYLLYKVIKNIKNTITFIITFYKLDNLLIVQHIRI